MSDDTGPRYGWRRSFTWRQRDMAKAMLAAGKSILQVHTQTRVSVGTCSRLRTELCAAGVLQPRGRKLGARVGANVRKLAKPKKAPKAALPIRTPEGFRPLTRDQLMAGRAYVPVIEN